MIPILELILLQKSQAPFGTHKICQHHGNQMPKTTKKCED
jgi:hypothetical protein